MAENNLKAGLVKIWHPNGTSNIVSDIDLPYWLSDAGGGWLTEPPGSQAAEQLAPGEADPPTPTESTFGSIFNSNPTAPQGSVIKRPDKGQFSLVYFSSDPTPNDPQTGQSYWIYNSTDKTFRPVSSYADLDNFVRGHGGTSAQEAMKLAINLNIESVRDPAMGWEGEFLGLDYAPLQDGSLPPYNNPNRPSEAITNKYGATTRNYDGEKLTLRQIRDTMSMLEATGDLSSASIAKLEDPNNPLLGKYLAACEYGGYTLGEVWQDLKIQELAETDPSYVGKKAISDTMNRNQYINTEEYNLLAKDPNLVKPIESISNGEDILNRPVGMMNDSFFQGVTPIMDWNDPANQAKLDEIEANWYDLTVAQNNAVTEQAKAQADSNFQKYISDLNKQYGLNLSNNVETAWGQLNELTSNMEQSGLAGSGVEREAQERILADVRKSNDIIRQNKLSDEEAEMRKFLLNFADESQIDEIVSRLDQEDAAAGVDPSEFRSVKWGVVPSAETIAWFEPNALKERFPDLSSREIELLRGQLLDNNNRFRSALYRNAIGAEYDTTRNKREFRINTYLEQLARERENANLQYESSLGSFVPPGEETSGDQQVDTTVEPPTPQPTEQPTFTPTPTTTPTDSAYARTDAVTEMLRKAEERRRNAANAAGSISSGSSAPPRPAVSTPSRPAVSTPSRPSGGTSGSTSSGSTSGGNRLRQIKIKHSSGGEQTVMQGDWDDYWKNQSGWSQV